MAHSPYTNQAVAYVEAHPGCCKYNLARHLTYCQLRNPSKQYYLVNTQIRLENIIAVRVSNRYELYTPEQYDRLFPYQELPPEIPNGCPVKATLDSEGGFHLEADPIPTKRRT